MNRKIKHSNPSLPFGIHISNMAAYLTRKTVDNFQAHYR